MYNKFTVIIGPDITIRDLLELDEVFRSRSLSGCTLSDTEICNSNYCWTGFRPLSNWILVSGRGPYTEKKNTVSLEGEASTCAWLRVRRTKRGLF